MAWQCGMTRPWVQKMKVNNVFAYNTIDLGWRAGLLAIYGGQGHKVYNNYLCDLVYGSRYSL